MGIFAKLTKVFRTQATQDLIDNLEEVLIESGLSLKLAHVVMDELDNRMGGSSDIGKVTASLKEILQQYAREYEIEIISKKRIFLFIGVNGVGKTTTIAKFVHYLRQYHKVPASDIVIAAGDTFRAGAIEQIGVHADKLGVHLIKQNAGADPAAVIFDTLSYAKSKNIPYIIADTAGRMNNRKDLVSQLQKIYRLLQRELSEDQITTFIILDGNSGLNTISQVEDFKAAVPIDAIVLSKYDGSSRGGSLLSIANSYGMPCAFLGTGEKYEDLSVFKTEEFLDDFLLH